MCNSLPDKITATDGRDCHFPIRHMQDDTEAAIKFDEDFSSLFPTTRAHSSEGLISGGRGLISVTRTLT